MRLFSFESGCVMMVSVEGVVEMGLDMRDRWSVPVTAVANEFIDSYMASANGEYVKEIGRAHV